VDPSAAPSQEDTTLSLAQISTPLQLPDAESLTQSKHLYSIATHTNIRSMTIKEDIEFYLFMDMQAKYQWTSFNMTPQKWVIATTEYSKWLEEFSAKNSCLMIKKHPRALMDLLREIEPKIANCIIRGDFVCKSACVLQSHNLFT
jgi:hypothetical protein